MIEVSPGVGGVALGIVERFGDSCVAHETIINSATESLVRISDDPCLIDRDVPNRYAVNAL